jgi:alkylation response protein AidB-like acyl-CoA dehydrogenase
MNLALSETQEMIRKSARDFLSSKCPKTLVREMEQDDQGYSPVLWQQMAELGWMGLVFPEKYGGAGMSFLDIAMLLEEMGRACLPSPFFSTVVLGGLPILDLGSEKQKEEYLPKISNGEIVLTLALTEPSARYDASSITVKATANGNDYIISGTKLFIPDAHIADYMLCVARTSEQIKAEDGITIFIVDTKNPGISCKVLDTIAKDKLCEVVFDQVRVPKENILGQLDRGWSELRKTIERASVAKCCEMVGGAHQVLEMTVTYAKERVQFGRPIGSFQAIQHHCADMMIYVDGSRLITYRAAWMLSQGIPCTKEVAVAKAWTGEAYRKVIFLGHQVHGGIGFTLDYDLQLYFRRAKAAEVTFGDANFYSDIVADEMGF